MALGRSHVTFDFFLCLGGETRQESINFHISIAPARAARQQASKRANSAMPPSQLKRLKASLREKGIVGPQKSKKEKKRSGKDGAERAAQRHAALAGIRENFNPFEIKAPARPDKFESTSLDKAKGKNGKGALGRPGVTKSLGEETVSSWILGYIISRL